MALSAQAEIPPAIDRPGRAPTARPASPPSRTPTSSTRTAQPKPPAMLEEDFARPAVKGNFQPIEPNTAGSDGGFFTNCAQQAKFGTPEDGPGAEHEVVRRQRHRPLRHVVQLGGGEFLLRLAAPLVLPVQQRRDHRSVVRRPDLRHRRQLVPGAAGVLLDRQERSLHRHQPDGREDQPLRATLGADLPGRRQRPTSSPIAPCSRGDKTTCNIDLDGTGYWQGGGLQSQTPDQHLRRPALRRRQPVPQRRRLEVRPSQPCQGKRPASAICPTAASAASTPRRNSRRSR